MQTATLYACPTRERFGYETETSRRIFLGWPILRITMGAIFLWAFLDKLFGLGFATKAAGAWINGGSPTKGFLTFGTKGPFADFFQGIAGHPVTDALFMLGLGAVGVSLLLGIGVRIAGYSGALMVMLMWLAALPPANHPILDDHVVYAIVLVSLAHAGAGRRLGLGSAWMRQPLVRKYPVLE